MVRVVVVLLFDKQVRRNVTFTRFKKIFKEVSKVRKSQKFLGLKTTETQKFLNLLIKKVILPKCMFLII